MATIRLRLVGCSLDLYKTQKVTEGHMTTELGQQEVIIS